jgi:hypothetical protein
MLEIFLDQQALGLPKYLEAVGLTVRDDSLRGSNDTGKGIPDEQVREFVAAHPDVILVTMDRKFAKKAKATDLRVIFVDESEVEALDVLRKLALMKR